MVRLYTKNDSTKNRPIRYLHSIMVRLYTYPFVILSVPAKTFTFHYG